VLAANRIKNKTSATRNFLRKLKYSVPAIFFQSKSKTDIGLNNEI
jgi:hypothetical protein